MSLTVGELIAIPTLKTRVLAGHNGLHREIHWAHSCELPEPWHWMGSGDLLMTIGLGLPSDAQGQITYLRELAQAGLSGVVLAEGMSAPRLTTEATHAADQFAFPVLETGYEIPFVTLARAVIDSNQRESHLRLSRVLRLYDSFRLAMRPDEEGDSIFQRIASIVDVPMCVLDVTDGSVEVSMGLSLEEAELDAVMARVNEQSVRLPSVLRANTRTKSFTIQPLSDGRRWVLVTAILDRTVDLAVLEHAATITLVQLERRRSAELARLHFGGLLLTNLTQGRTDAGLAAAELSTLGLDGPPWRLIMVGNDRVSDLVAVQRRLLAAAVPHILGRVNSHLLVLTDEGIDITVIATAAVGSNPDHVGVSNAFDSLSRIPEAVHEARWALEASSTRNGIVRHGDSSLFLPRTVSEGQAAVSRVLGALINYDAEHDTNLVDSLEVFFAMDRSWQAAAQQLCIHKQTLVYRMRRVEEITGRQLGRIDDVVELHLALRSRALLRDT